MKGSQVNCRLGVEDVRRLHEVAGPYGGIAKWILAKLDDVPVKAGVMMKVSNTPAVVPLEPAPKPFIKETRMERCQRLNLKPGDICLGCRNLNMSCTCDG